MPNAGCRPFSPEAERVVRFGFTQSELDREKLDSQRCWTKPSSKRQGPSCRSLTNSFDTSCRTNHVPGIVYEQAMSQRFLPGITLQEVKRLAKTWVPDGNRVISVNAPERPGLSLPTTARLSAAISAVNAATLTRFTSTKVANQPLLAVSVPSPGTISKTATRRHQRHRSGRCRTVSRHPEAHAVQGTDSVPRGQPGGTSIASDQDLVAAETAEQVLSESGLGAFSSIELNKMLAGVSTGVQAYIGEIEEGVRGGSTRKDVEDVSTHLSQLHVATRGCHAVRSVEGAAASDAGQPAGSSRDRLPSGGALGPHAGQSACAPTHAVVDRSDEPRTFLAFHKNRFADASDFTFVFVGAIDVPTFKPLVERYLQSSRASPCHEAAVDRGVHRPAASSNARRWSGRRATQ